MAKRQELLNTLVATSLLWWSVSWNLTSSQVSRLRGVQQNMLLKMISLRVKSEETKAEVMARANRKISKLRKFAN